MITFEHMRPEGVLYLLGPDDLPACPKHGIRLVTDFFVAEHGEEVERGKCPLCNKSYLFQIEEGLKNA
jgi:hypothetical protein